MFDVYAQFCKEGSLIIIRQPNVSLWRTGAAIQTCHVHFSGIDEYKLLKKPRSMVKNLSTNLKYARLSSWPQDSASSISGSSSQNDLVVRRGEAKDEVGVRRVSLS